MQKLEMEPLVYTGFQLTPRVEDGKLIVGFSGNGDMSAVEALGRFLKQGRPLGSPASAPTA
jgi:hypothetical protein